MAIFSDMDQYTYIPKCKRPFLQPERTLDFKVCIDTRDGKRILLENDQVFQYTADQSIPANANLVGATEAASYSLEFDNSAHKLNADNLANARVRAWIGVEVEYTRTTSRAFYQPMVTYVNYTGKAPSGSGYDIGLTVKTQQSPSLGLDAAYLRVSTIDGTVLGAYDAATYSKLQSAIDAEDAADDDDTTVDLVDDEAGGYDGKELFDDTPNADPRVWAVTVTYPSSASTYSSRRFTYAPVILEASTDGTNWGKKRVYRVTL